MRRAGKVIANILFLACLLSSFSVWAEAANTSFSPPVSYTVGQAPSEVVVDDFNGDGIPDLVILSLIGNGLNVLLGKGDGTFQAAINYPLPSGLGPLATGDFNGDGRLDLLVADSNGGELTVLLGNGDGTFRSAGTASLTESPGVVAVGDFNGDARQDVAVLESSPPVPDQLTILLGDGQGNLQTTAGYSISGIRSSIIVKDLNGDNKQDLVMAVGNHVGVLRGNGDGTFQQIQYLPLTTGKLADSVAAGDFNRDGKLDLIVVSHQVCIALLCPVYVELFVGIGDGTFQGPSLIAQFRAFLGGTVIVADFDRDGNLDAVVDTNGEQGGTLSVLMGNGGGTFQEPINLLVDHLKPVFPVAADLNGDNLTDLIVPDAETADGNNYNINVLLNTTNAPTFVLSLVVNGSGTGTVSVPLLSPCANVCSISFAAGTKVTLGEQPNSGSSFTDWSGACSGTGACTVVMNSDESVTATFNSIAVPDFSLTASTLSPGVVKAGQPTTGIVTINPSGGFNSTVSFRCSVQPSPSRAPTCAVTPSGSGASVTVMTTAPGFAQNLSRSSGWFYALWIPLIGFACSSIRTARKDKRRKLGVVVIILLSGITFQSACGGGSAQDKQLSGGTPPGNYTITVTGTSGSLQHSTTFALGVQ